MRTSKTSLLVIGLLLTSLIIMAYLVHSPYEITRLRNALITSAGEPSDFNWQPANPPADYSLETLSPPDVIQQTVDQLGLSNAAQSELSRSLEIARHMNGPDKSNGDAIQSSFTDAYRQIVEKNIGYCSDFTQVFNGLALAADIPVREWGMSFDGFSGDGHAFSEIYDTQLGQWVFIDSFYAFYVVDPVTERPLSVLELRKRLDAGQASALAAGVRPITQDTFAFKSGELAMQYYTKGVSEFFLWFGTDVFSYDANKVIKFASKFGRSAEQAVAILLGEHPSIRVYEVAQSEPALKALSRARSLFFFAFVCGLSAVVIFLAAWRRSRNVAA